MIAAIGNLSLDVVDGRRARPGGTVFYSALTLAHLGASARIGASCAAADRALLQPALESFRLPVTWYESKATTSYRIRYAKSGRRLMRQDAIGDPWSAERAVEAAGEAEWVHAGSLVRTDFAPKTLAALSQGRTLLLDGQGLVRRPTLGPLRRDAAVPDVFRHVAILKLDGEEASLLTAGAGPEALRSLGVPEVLVTLGERGSFVLTGDRIDAVPAVGVEGAVDPTGAGDMFSAAYLAGRASGGEPVAAARAAAETVAALLGSRERRGPGLPAPEGG